MENPVNDKESTCRICFQQNATMVPIFLQKYGVSPYENLIHHTKLNISYNDGGSESMCQPCSEELEILVKFLNKCVRSNERFATYKQNSIGPAKSDKDASKSDTDSEKLIINEDSISSDNEHDPNMSIQINATNKKEFACQCCRKTFTKPENLRLHLYRHNGERNHYCIRCGAGVLTRALAIQHCSPRPRRQCPAPGCPMSFLSTQSLKIHIRKHNGEKPFECADCHRKFGSKATLRNHMKVHTRTDPYICPVCGKQFVTNKLSLHMRTHRKHAPATHAPATLAPATHAPATHAPATHAPATPAPGTHPCAACPRVFSSARSLAQHAFRHGPRVRTHTCNKCNAAYNQKKSLTKHIKKMHGEATTSQHPISTNQPTII